MKTFITRLAKLEAQLVPPVDQRAMNMVSLLRERRRRRLGESDQLMHPSPVGSGRLMTIADVLRDRHREHRTGQAAIP